MDAKILAQIEREYEEPFLDPKDMAQLRRQVFDRLLLLRDQNHHRLAIPREQSEEPVQRLTDQILSLFEEVNTEVGVASLSLVMGVISQAVANSTGISMLGQVLKTSFEELAALRTIMLARDAAALVGFSIEGQDLRDLIRERREKHMNTPPSNKKDQ